MFLSPDKSDNFELKILLFFLCLKSQNIVDGDVFSLMSSPHLEENQR